MIPADKVSDGNASDDSVPGATTSADLRRRIPPVDRLLEDPELVTLEQYYGRRAVRVQVNALLDELRRRLAEPDGASRASDEAPGDEPEATLERLGSRVRQRLEARFDRPLSRVLNATGVFLHTNLGRAPLPRSVARSLPALLDASCDLEMDLVRGQRSDRNRRVEPLLTELTGAEAAVVVNNNAGALVLTLATLAAGREVVVSRGELVEIGGSFRLPDIFAAAGARLVEVGTTNRVHRRDYEEALGPETALLLKVFPSNYRISGYTAEVAPEELARLGREHGVPVLVDEGSGLLRRHPAPQLAGHPSFAELVEAGCPLVVGSGDKLLGGPQAGLLVGDRTLIGRLRRHPLYRPLRPDRATYAGLEAVLRLHLADGPLPLDRLWPDPRAHRRRLETTAEALRAVGAEAQEHAEDAKDAKDAAGGRLVVEVVEAAAQVGGGSAPERPIPGHALALDGVGVPVADGTVPEALLDALRRGDPPVVGYLRDGRAMLDLRTVDPEDDPLLVGAVRRAARAVLLAGDPG